MQFEPVRRLASGSIDYEFYHRRAVFIRSSTIAAAFKDNRDILMLLLAIASVALALTWLLHTPIGSMDDETEVTRARLVRSPHLTVSTFARHHHEGHHAAC